ncbi:MAG: hypothetical protein ABIG64_08670 [Candidatus Omnitrophota bacterium]
MRLIKVFNLCVVFFAVFSFLSKYCLEAADNQCFKIVPFKVGQWVEYQIVSLEEQSKDNRYKISVLNEEIIDGEIYFWIGFDVFNQGKREISFKALMKNFKTDDLKLKKEQFIAEGIISFFKASDKLYIKAGGSEWVEVNPKTYFLNLKLLENSFYEQVPDELGKVDYSKLVMIGREEINVSSQEFNCLHYQVKTNPSDEFSDEGIDLWRSDKVPFLGIVKLEFSKTDYDLKLRYQESKILASKSIFYKIFYYLFNKLPKDTHTRKDIYKINLIDYKNY